MIQTILGLILIAGSYGADDQSNVRTYSFDETDGILTPIDSVSGLSNPSFISSVGDGCALLAVNEDDGATAALSMLRRDAPGRYTKVASCLTGGSSPCHVAVSPDGRYAVTANYSGGSISVVEFDVENASFGIPSVTLYDGCGADSVRQASPHPHFTTFTPDGRLMMVNDLGTDRVNTYMLDTDGTPVISSVRYVEMPAGSGPRHTAFSPGGNDAYIINEIDGHVIHLRYDSIMGILTPLSKTFADYGHGEGSADIHVSPDGRHLYVSNRLKGDGIAVFAIDPTDGSLTPAGFIPTGLHPRNFAITPSGEWVLVACRDSDRIEVYRRNPSDGSLMPTAHSVSCSRPVCLLFE